MTSLLKRVSLIGFVLGVSLAGWTAPRSQGGISSIELDREAKKAHICLKQGTEVSSDKYYGHADLQGYVIKLKYGPSCEQLLSSPTGVSPDCFIGSYRIDSRGFAPHIYITLEEKIIKHRSTAPSRSADAPNEITIRPLKANDPLRAASQDVATEWRDNNVSTGKTSLLAGFLAQNIDTAELKKLSADLFHQSLRKNTQTDVPPGTRLSTTGGALSNARLKKLVLTLAEGSAYDTSNSENLDVFKNPLKELIPQLGPENKNVLYMTQAQLTQEVDPSEKRTVTTAYILNTETQKLLLFFIIEGTI